MKVAPSDEFSSSKSVGHRAWGLSIVFFYLKKGIFTKFYRLDMIKSGFIKWFSVFYGTFWFRNTHCAASKTLTEFNSNENGSFPPPASLLWVWTPKLYSSAAATASSFWRPSGPTNQNSLSASILKGDKGWRVSGLGPTVHEEPVSRQHPDEHQHDWEREGQQLGQCEAAAAAEGNPGEGWRIKETQSQRKNSLHRRGSAGLLCSGSWRWRGSRIRILLK